MKINCMLYDEMGKIEFKTTFLCAQFLKTNQD